MYHNKLLLFSFFIIVLAGCSDHDHLHDENLPNHSPNTHDSIN